MGPKLRYCMDVMGIVDIADVTESNIKRAFRKIAVNVHPDKGGGDAGKFVELTEARDTLSEFLIAKAFAGSRGTDGTDGTDGTEGTDGTDGTNSGGSVDDKNCGSDIWEWVASAMRTKDSTEINNAFRKMVGDVAMKLFDTVGTENMLRNYELFVKYREFLCLDDDTLDAIKARISQSTHAVILNPTVDDLLNDNVFRLNYMDDLFNIPLWHSELYYDLSEGELVVRCVPILGDDVWISGTGDIHKCVDVWLNPGSPDFDWTGSESVAVGCRTFTVLYGDLKVVPTQSVVFRGMGPAKINTQDMYDVCERLDVVIHVRSHFGVKD